MTIKMLGIPVLLFAIMLCTGCPTQPEKTFNCIGNYVELDIDSALVSEVLFGNLKDGIFIAKHVIPVVSDVQNIDNVNASIINGYSNVIRINLFDFDAHSSIDSFHVFLWGKKTTGEIIDSIPAIVWFFRHETDRAYYTIVFDHDNGSRKGKHVLMVTEDTPDSLVGELEYTYTVRIAANSNVKMRIEATQLY